MGEDTERTDVMNIDLMGDELSEEQRDDLQRAMADGDEDDEESEA